jgi:predicted XRE-type DNA-binding protein
MDDPVVVALEAVKQAVQRNIEVGHIVLERADAIMADHLNGKPWSAIVKDEDRPLIVELLTSNLNRLMSAGGQLRRAKAKALHDDGMTMEQIAHFFGVTRQRVSALLNDRSSDEAAIDLTT